jgi:hypothetical protein
LLFLLIMMHRPIEAIGRSYRQLFIQNLPVHIFKAIKKDAMLPLIWEKPLTDDKGPTISDECGTCLTIDGNRGI